MRVSTAGFFLSVDSVLIAYGDDVQLHGHPESH